MDGAGDYSDKKNENKTKHNQNFVCKMMQIQCTVASCLIYSSNWPLNNKSLVCVAKFDFCCFSIAFYNKKTKASFVLII